MSREIGLGICGCRAHRSANFFAALLAGLLLSPVGASADTLANPNAKAPAGTKAGGKKLGAADAAAKAEALVKEALYYEIYGKGADRDRLLAEARAVAPDYAPAMWQSGHVRDGKRWLKADDIPALAAKNGTLSRYVRKREEIANGHSGQLQIARWCESRGLDHQARAHFDAVLAFNADHAEARSKLGFRRVNGRWISAVDRQNLEARSRQANEALEHWLPTAIDIHERLASASETDRKDAEKRLAEINDPAALVALERVFTLSSESVATVLVEKASEWTNLETTRSLALQSVFSPWNSVRSLAAERLKGRPYEDYLPEMLAAMQSPIVRQSFMERVNDWTVNRQTLVRERQDRVDVLAMETAYTRVQGRGRNNQESLSRAALQLRNEVTHANAVTDYAVAVQNARTEELNSRIMDSLAVATSQATNVTAGDWWNWWNQEVEKEFVGGKSTNFVYGQRQVVFDDPLADPYYMPPMTSTPWLPYPTPLLRAPYLPTASCFAAGTPVWTITGPQAIEKVCIGDVVLSQDQETGEVATKPVMRTTIRPAVPTFTIETSGGTLRCTGGHLFWVPGEGWTKARHLRSGQTLHCATGTVQVSDVAETAAEPTYNLVVADFNTYFVGPEKIFTHDVTDRKPCRALVPGLPRE